MFAIVRHAAWKDHCYDRTKGWQPVEFKAIICNVNSSSRLIHQIYGTGAMTFQPFLSARVLATATCCALLFACAGKPTQPQVRTLSAQEAEVLRSGGSEELALPAELNGYPSPRRALDMGEALALTPDQRFALTRLNSVTQGKARALGERIVVAEQNLDLYMAAARQPMDRIRAHLDKIAALHAALRGVRIEAHMEAFDILTEAQRQQYAQLRELPPPPVEREKPDQPTQTPLY